MVGKACGSGHIARDGTVPRHRHRSIQCHDSLWAKGCGQRTTELRTQKNT